MKINQIIKNSFALTLLLNFNAMADQPSISIKDNNNLMIDTVMNKTASYQVTLSGPDNFYLRKVFLPGQSINFDMKDLPNNGLFKTEIIEQPMVDKNTLRLIRAGDKTAVASISNNESLNMSFRLDNNALLDDKSIEKNEGIETKDQVFNDDLIVTFSACVGNDCVNGENFGFDTLRLKENNLQIHFDDTSASASFPSNDWRLKTNDTSNGGSSYFAIEDSTAGRIPFKVEAGAPVNALYVESDGDVGIKTANPVVDLHIVEGDSPTVRLEQDGSNGFAAQTWDLAGNEANFFIRDVTNGSKLPFRIIPDAEADHLVLKGGNTGLFTASPQQDLHIRRNGNATIGLESTGTGDPDWTISNNGVTDSFEISDTTDSNLAEDLDGAEFSLDATGNLTIAGLLIQNSNVHAKHQIMDLNTSEILAKLKQMPISQWQYKAMPGNHIGPMAQDFYATFNLGQDDSKIAVLDVAGVALVAVKALSEQLDEKQNKIQMLEQKIALLENHSADQQERLAGLEAYENRLVKMEKILNNYKTLQVNNSNDQTDDVEKSNQNLLD